MIKWESVGESLKRVLQKGMSESLLIFSLLDTQRWVGEGWIKRMMTKIHSVRHLGIDDWRKNKRGYFSVSQPRTKPETLKQNPNTLLTVCVQIVLILHPIKIVTHSNTEFDACCFVSKICSREIIWSWAVRMILFVLSLSQRNSKHAFPPILRSCQEQGEVLLRIKEPQNHDHRFQDVRGEVWFATSTLKNRKVIYVIQLILNRIFKPVPKRWWMKSLTVERPLHIWKMLY